MSEAISERATQGHKFGPAADDYQRGRPGYPPEVVARAAAGLDLPASATVVDLGAGTGKLTQVLADRFDRVIAVEPLPEMRAELARTVPGAEPLAGDAEHLPLPDGAARAVFVAEAFHWFDGPRALAEVARVTGPGGGIVLLWNQPVGPWQPALPEPARQAVSEAIARGGQPGGPRIATGEWRAAFDGSDFGPLHHEQVAHELALDREAMIASMLSISSIAGQPAAEREALRERLRDLLPAEDYRRALHAQAHWARVSGPAWCDRCGRAVADGGHQPCAAARTLEPPRYCPHCRRRMKVQVLPGGWAARCVEHGESRP